MELVGSIAELWRYPVKSTGGERLASAPLDARGIVGDRRWAVHTADGKFGSGKSTRRFRRIDGLLHLRSRLDGHEPVVTLPGGAELRGTGPAVDAALATALGMPGVGLREEGDVPHFDAHGVHLISTSAVEWLERLLPDAALSVARFRPNLVVTGRTEASWAGRDLTIGAARLRVAKPTERCVMVTAEQPDLAHDSRILRTLATETNLMFGIYAEVVTPGTIREGDSVELH
jgi:uncharacterized protein YcbX